MDGNVLYFDEHNARRCRRQDNWGNKPSTSYFVLAELVDQGIEILILTYVYYLVNKQSGRVERYDIDVMHV